MVFRIDFKKFLISIAIPLLVGGLSALITKGNMDIYGDIKRPPLSPPSSVFAIVWPILYFLMGVSLYLVWNSNVPQNTKNRAFIIFFIQLFLNFIWSPIFFNGQRFLLAFIVLVLLWISALVMIINFFEASKPAALMQIPYLIWLTFAGYLNFTIYLLN